MFYFLTHCIMLIVCMATFNKIFSCLFVFFFSLLIKLHTRSYFRIIFIVMISYYFLSSFYHQNLISSKERKKNMNEFICYFHTICLKKLFCLYKFNRTIACFFFLFSLTHKNQTDSLNALLVNLITFFCFCFFFSLFLTAM